MTLCPNCSIELEAGARFCSACGTKIGELAVEDQGPIGSTLNGKYRVISELGSGAVGTVYLGEHLSLKKQVALKLLHSDLQIGKEALVRFQREGIAAGKFNHAGAIQIFDFDVEGENTWYLAMEYVEGKTLKQYVQEKGPIEIEEALDLAEQILSVLAEAHRQGIVHRDLKPENIMVSTNAAGEPVIKVLDFGLSKLLDRGIEASMMTQTGRIMGTPMYMSPEQCAGREVDHRTDLYAAGLVFYEMLCGAPPFQASNLTELLIKQATEEVPSLVDSYPDMSFPEDVNDILDCALAKDPDDRFDGAGEMLAALEAVDLQKIGKASKRRSAGRTRAGGSGRRRRAKGVAPTSSKGLLLGFGMAVVLALGVWGLMKYGGTRPDHPRLSMHEPEVLTEEELLYVGHLDRTLGHIRKRELSEAIDSVGDAIAMPCSDAEAFLLRGRIYHMRGDVDTASADYREALDLDPQYALARASLGWLALERGDRATAAESFEQAITIDQDCAAALAGDGAMQFQDGQFSAAKELLERALEGDAETPRAEEYLGRTLLAMEDYDGAIEAFVQAKRHDSQSWQAPAGLGEAYYGKSRYEDAERQLREAIELAGEEWELRLKFATLLVELERFEDANEQIRAGLDRKPDSGPLQVLSGVASYQTGNRRLAIERLQGGIALGAAEFEAQLLCGILLQAEGRPADALPYLEGALALRDDSADAHADYGLALAALQRFEEAARELERAGELDEDRPFLHITLGALYMNYLSDPDRALGHFRSYLEAGGDDERVAGWVEDLER